MVGSSPPNIKYHHIATLRLLWSYLGSKNPAWLLRYEIEKGLRTIFSSLMCPCRHRNHHDIGMEQHTKATLQRAMDGGSRRNPTCKIDETLYFTKTPKMFYACHVFLFIICTSIPLYPTPSGDPTIHPIHPYTYSTTVGTTFVYDGLLSALLRWNLVDV